MKIAFLLLMLANLTFWLYERQHAPSLQPADAPAIAPGAYREPIVLARELPNTPAKPSRRSGRAGNAIGLL